MEIIHENKTNKTMESTNQDNLNYQQVQSLLDNSKKIDMSEIFRDAYFSEFLDNIH